MAMAIVKDKKDGNGNGNWNGNAIKYSDGDSDGDWYGHVILNSTPTGLHKFLAYHMHGSRDCSKW